MKSNLPTEINEILKYSREEAMRTGNYEISTDHLILGIIRHQNNAGYELLKELNVPIPYLKSKIAESLDKKEIVPYQEIDAVDFAPNIKKVIEDMFLEAREVEDTTPNSLFLILAILRNNNSFFSVVMTSIGFTYQRVRLYVFGDNSQDEQQEEDIVEEKKPTSNKSHRKNKESVLESYGFDLTKAAAEGRIDPVVGREKEIERLAQILGRRKKNNPILIGEPGVGKSAIAEGLAIKIAEKNISRALINKKIISLDIGSIVAGTKFRGQFEERIKSILKELKENRDTILFIDEMHTLVGAGGAPGSLDAANMLKPALARGEIQCIGATTLDEFREIIEKDGALERRFQKIMIEPTSFEETMSILENIKDKYEEHHNVKYSNESLKACITLSNRYISDRCLPDKAIDVMDEAGSKAHIKSLKVSKKILKLEDDIDSLKNRKRELISANDFQSAELIRKEERHSQAKLVSEMEKWDKKRTSYPQEITPEDISYTMSMMTGIPISKIALSESNQLLQMAQTLQKKVIGQDDAVNKVTHSIQRNRAGLKSPNKPIGTFLFLGPTGVGKTQLAKVLAEFMFDTSDSIIRIDMSEYMEKFAMSRLIGAPPGYVGYGEGGQLSEKVRRKPYSVVLLDEIEKAHPDIFNLLLQVMDEGKLTDSNGRNIDFRNTVLIMTSNIGSRELKDFGKGIGYANTTKTNNEQLSRSIVEKAIGKTFTPEFINRLDEQIFFNSLTRGDIEKITTIELADLFLRVEEAGYKLNIAKTAKKFVADMGYDSRYGARPLKRSIRIYIEDVVAQAIISGAPIGSTIKLVLNKEKNGLIIQ